MSETREPEEMSVLGLVDEFKDVHHKMADRAFAFVLGAGASRSSGIRTAGEMASEWIKTLHVRSGSTTVAPTEWASAETLRIEAYDPGDMAAAYPALYARLFGADPAKGYAHLEYEMKDAEPSYGYSVLARILATTRHQVVVTTNFDNLVADSLSIFSKTFPLVCGHESLAAFVRAQPRRPLVVKLHRDLLLAPKSTPEDLAALPDAYAAALDQLFMHYTPIVIGYGGNDGSLMGYLAGRAARALSGGVYWCYWDGGPRPGKTIRDFVAAQGGYIVPIPGFDELMLLLGDALKFDVPDKFVLDRAAERAARIVQQTDTLRHSLAARDARAHRFPEGGGAATALVAAVAAGKRALAIAAVASTKEEDGTSASAEALPAVRRALEGTMERTDGRRRWWQWERLALAEPDPKKREEIYERALHELPDSAPLLGRFANFLIDKRKDRERAESYYERALQLDPNNAVVLGNFANFQAGVRNDHDRAEQLYQQSIQANPKLTTTLGNFARFLASVRRDYDRAEALYEKAIALDPDHARNLSYFAGFLSAVRKDHDRAEALFERALDNEPNHIRALVMFADFLADVRKDPEAARELCEKAVALEPNNAALLSSYARILSDVCRDHARAQHAHERARDLAPTSAAVAGCFAVFLASIRKDHARAEALFEQTLEAAPEEAAYLGNFAWYDLGRGRVEEGKQRLERALEMIAAQAPGPLHAECWMYAYCHRAPEKQPEALRRLRALIVQDAICTRGWDFSGVIATAVERGHAQQAWLPKLAEVLAGRAEVDTLDEWEAWRAAA